MTPISGPISPHRQVDETTLLLCALGAFFLLFGLFSHLVRGRLSVPSAVLATLFGILLGPTCLDLGLGAGWTNGSEGESARSTLLYGSRIALGIQVLSAGLELPSNFFRQRKNWQGFVTLLGPVIVCSWITCSLIIYACLPCSVAEALTIAACLTPTDPALVATVVKGHFAARHISQEIRDTLLAESGANDGLGSPFIYLALSILYTTYPVPPEGAPTSAMGIFFNFIVSALLYNVLLSVVLGFVTGYLGQKLFLLCRRKEWFDEESMLPWSIAFSLFLVGISTLIDTNQLLCCFVAGVTLNWHEGVSADIRTPFAEGVDNILDIVVFTVLGAVLPFDHWVKEDITQAHFWQFLLVSLLIMLFRRLPFILLFGKGLKSIEDIWQKMFIGWFGPIGIGVSRPLAYFSGLTYQALYYSLEATEKLPGQAGLHQRIYSSVTFVIFVSVFVHGLSIPFFLLMTSCFPHLAPKFLGAREEVKQDFPYQDDLEHYASRTASRTQSPVSNERAPLISK